jgi:hypothetical protein
MATATSTSGRRTRTRSLEVLGALALLSAASCTCELPSSIPSPDGGGGGAGGGAQGAGGGSADSCVVASCPAADGGICTYPYDAGSPLPSCIAGTCVNECGGGRHCEVTDGGRCLDCGALGAACAMDACQPKTLCTFTARAAQCVGLIDDGSQWTVTQGADCRQTVANNAGVILGSWFDLGGGAFVAQVPRLGGSCTGQDLFTNVPRMQVYCPYCTFVAEGCE